MFAIFTTREIAAAIWVSAFVPLAIASREIRQSLANLIAAAVRWKIVIPVVLMMGYTGLSVWALWFVGLWTTDLLKDTIIWFFFAGLALAFSSVKDSGSEHFLRQAVWEQLKAMVLIEYMVSTYTLSFLFEMVLFPVLVGLAIADAVAKSDPKFAQVAKLTSWLLTFAGAALFAAAAHEAIWSFELTQTGNVLRAVTLAPILSVMFLPCVYALVLYAVYDELRVRLKFRTTDDETLSGYAARRVISFFMFRPHRIRSFVRNNASALMEVRTKADVHRLLAAAHGSSPGAPAA